MKRLLLTVMTVLLLSVGTARAASIPDNYQISVTYRPGLATQARLIKLGDHGAYVFWIKQ